MEMFRNLIVWQKAMELGGIRYLLPVIEAAYEIGMYVITAEDLLDNRVS